MTEPTGPETAAGREIEVVFDGKLCIHSRFCVLQAPDVFKANTPGQWIMPDAMDASALAAVARNCPSGAITYRSADPRLDEVDPPVNTIRIRENGPYAVNARIAIPGETIAARRRTLCRCGASNNKPFCDGSHAAVGFTASGEPATEPTDPLDPRNGLLTITPMPDGPLEVQGSLELVSGTGRTFAKSVHCLLCRCGGSSSKPFCDGTHAMNGFTDRAGVACVPSRTPAVGTPTLAEWAGGRETLGELTAAFYDRVPHEPLLADLFSTMDRKHAEHVADFLVEVFSGPTAYTAGGGSHIGMIVKHLGRNISEAQRARWVEVMIETAVEIGMPADPAFRATFTSYLEWGSKLAVINSASGIRKPEGQWPMPRWGWGPSGEPSAQDMTPPAAEG